MNYIPPGRIYLHSSSSEIFSHKTEFLENFSKMFPWMNKQKLDYFIAIYWGKEKNKGFDFFGYSGTKENWNSNSKVKNWVIKNGRINPLEVEITCGEGLILLGKEEEYRLKTKNLQEYLSTPLDIKEINKLMKK